MRIRVSRITSRIPEDWSKAAEKEVKRALQRTKTPVIKEFGKVVANWEHKPRFVGKVNGYAIEVRPTGPNARIYRYVDEGTRPHPIAAKNAPTLRFRWGGPGSYVPKTKPVGQFGGPGIVKGGSWRSPKEVRHPGTEARHFAVIVGLEMAPVLAKAIRDAVSRVFQRTGGRGLK